MTSPSPPAPGCCWPASTSCSPPEPASASSGPTARGSRRCCACWPASAPRRAAPCGSPRPPPPSATCPKSPTPGPARPSGRCSPGGPAWPRPRPRSTTPPRHWRTATRPPPTGTPPPSTAGWRSAAPTSTPVSPPSPPTSGSLPTALDREVARLSGGQAARAQLAGLLLARFDVFLLDEPTNDLDLDGLDRLERFVLGMDAPLMVVSHDRAFLERTITAVAEIDDHAHTLTRYEGGWHAYLDERGPRPRARRAGTPRLHRPARRPRRSLPHPAPVGQPGSPAGQAIGRDRQVHPPPQHAELRARGRQGQDHRQGPRPPRRGRQALGGLGPAPLHRRRRARRRRRRPAGRRRRRATRRRRPTRLPARPGVARGRLG